MAKDIVVLADKETLDEVLSYVLQIRQQMATLQALVTDQPLDDKEK